MLNRIWPSRMTHHSRVSGWNRGETLLPGADWMYWDHRCSSLTTHSDHSFSPLCMAFRSASRVNGLMGGVQPVGLRGFGTYPAGWAFAAQIELKSNTTKHRATALRTILPIM